MILERFAVASGGDALLLPVHFGGKDHLFFVDSGCARTAIDLSLLPGKPRGSSKALTLNGRVEVEVYDPPAATVGRLPLHVGEVSGLDLNWAREVWGRPVEGILGMDFLGDYVLRVDFDEGELLLLKSAPMGAGNVVPFAWEPGKLPIVVAELSNMEKTPFVIDTGLTGSGSGALGALTLKAQVRTGDSRELGSDLAETAGGRYMARVYRGSHLALGGFAVEDPIFKETRMVNVLGLGFWSRFTVTFDFPERRAYLRKGKGYDRADAWNATGLRLRSKRGMVTIDAVDEGSPGARAGVLPSDVLLELDGLRADKTGMFELKSALCKAGPLGCVLSRGAKSIGSR
ncbi:MAG TPA: hypothetical protein VGZ22_32045 [Isosphaeraceae bacterium]|jgi:hypothetical protein|nr:hypothetical protein [Isosphaeraceae bacterium]